MLLDRLIVEDGCMRPTSRAHPRPQQLYRLPVKADGRCLVRAVLGGSNRHTDDLSYLREMRVAAVHTLAERMSGSEELDNFVRWSFPDEAYDSFEAWCDAQVSDDTEQANSDLWKGGGTWIAYGLGLHLGLRIIVHNVDSNEVLDPSSDGTVLLDARGADTIAEDDATVHLASVRADDGTANHFDILLLNGPQPGAEPLGCRGRGLLRSTSRPSVTLQLFGFLGWLSMSVLLLATFLGGRLPHVARMATGTPRFGQQSSARELWRHGRLMGMSGGTFSVGEQELMHEGTLRFGGVSRMAISGELPSIDRPGIVLPAGIHGVAA